MPVERGLAHLQACSKGGGRDAFTGRLLKHGRQVLQDLNSTLTRLGALSRLRHGTLCYVGLALTTVM
jgi:hypothetical protein